MGLMPFVFIFCSLITDSKLLSCCYFKRMQYHYIFFILFLFYLDGAAHS